MTMFGAVALSAAITTLLGISLMWTISGVGIVRLITACVVILSGLIVPLPLFPDWAQPVLSFLPFRGVADVPFRVYVGHIAPAEALGAFAHQIAWTVALVAVGRRVLSRGTRRLVVQGG
jgi:ABC-2 type transport system permease protein